MSHATARRIRRKSTASRLLRGLVLASYYTKRHTLCRVSYPPTRALATRAAAS